MEILVSFVERYISGGKYVIQNKLWDRRMKHELLEAQTWSVSTRFWKWSQSRQDNFFGGGIGELRVCRDVYFRWKICNTKSALGLQNEA